MGYLTKWLIIEEFSIFLNHRILSEKWVDMIRIIHLAFITHGSAQSYLKTDIGIKTSINNTDYEIQFFSPSIVRVIKWPEESCFTKKSLSVIKKPQKTEFNVNLAGKNLILKSDELVVVLNMNNGTVSFETPTGQQLLNEKEASTEFTEFNDAGNKTYSVSQSFALEKDEAIYGLGILQNGKMVQRDLEIHMVQNNTQDFVPFFQSTKGYGLFWDNYSPTIFSDNKEQTTFSSEVGDGIDYYFMYGENSDGVVACMRELTGQVPMFPLWTYGYWQSRERYKSQDETVGVVRKYRELGVPLDGIIQDWRYWGNNYLWNAMEFLNEEFYDPQKMVDNPDHVHPLFG